LFFFLGPIYSLDPGASARRPTINQVKNFPPKNNWYVNNSSKVGERENDDARARLILLKNNLSCSFILRSEEIFCNDKYNMCGV
jgi:hypothetical protein